MNRVSSVYNKDERCYDFKINYEDGTEKIYYIRKSSLDNPEVVMRRIAMVMERLSNGER